MFGKCFCFFMGGVDGDRALTLGVGAWTLPGLVVVVVGGGGVFLSVVGVLIFFLVAGVIFIGGGLWAGRRGDLVVFLEGCLVFCFFLGGLDGERA